MNKFNVGDYIFATDESRVYKIIDLPNEKFNMYRAIMVGDTFNRCFYENGENYRAATEEEIQKARDHAIGIYPYWVANKKNELIANGHIRAYTFERAKEIFNNMLERMKREGEKIGDYFLSDINEATL